MGASENRDSLAGRAIWKESPLPTSVYVETFIGGIKPPPTFTYEIGYNPISI